MRPRLTRLCARIAPIGLGIVLAASGCDAPKDAGSVDISKSKAAAATSGVPARGTSPTDESLKRSRPPAKVNAGERSFSRGN